MELFEAKRRWLEEAKKIYEAEERHRREYWVQRREQEKRLREEKAKASELFDAVKSQLASRILAERVS